ncbi:MAG: cohesin domain-containing protein [Betaproteobacteria bacterium]|nr:cohesin domain-containing protein [Betaproteobacteria bacterium]
MEAYREGQSLLAEGKTEQGLARLEEAVRLDPRNAEYRIALSNHRLIIINQLISAGEQARRENRLSDAEKIYRHAQTLDPGNAMARQGLDMLVQARRHQITLAEAEALLTKETADDLNTALEKLRVILTENPNHKPALNLKARVDAQRAQIMRPETQLAAIFRKPVSLEFREAPLKSVLEVISKVSGLNFFYDHEIRPDLKATIFAKNTSVEDAMRLILVTNRLEYKILNENSILIYPNTPQKLKEYQTLAIRSFYLTNADVKAVANSIKTLVKTRDLVMDERLGVIIMRDTPEAIRMAERIVALQDLNDPEVMLEVEILEIKRSRLLELGIQWPSQMTLSPLQLEGLPLTITDLRNLNRDTIQVGIGNVTVNARKEDQDGNILANPRIRVRNREKAKIQIGDRIPVITSTSTSTGFVAESVTYLDVGLKLEVEPSIHLNDEVAIKIDLEVSNLVREIMSSSGTLSYQIGTRGATTVLRLMDGETQVLAGLINDEDRTSANKFPLLGELPIVGRLFGSQKDDNQRSEILLSITPRIVRSIQRPDMLDAEFESGTESSVGSSSLRLSSIIETPVTETTNSADTADKQSGENPQATDNSASTTSDNPATEAAAGSITLDWQMPAQVRVGEQFSAVLRISSEVPLRSMPIMLGFDPQILQVVSVHEGDFFGQGNRQTNFNYRQDPAQGRISAAFARQTANEQDSGINGEGSLITVNFKAVKAGNLTNLQLLSATPEPMPAVPMPLPVERPIHILP